MTKRLEITLSDETWERLDAARAHEPRASFVKRALESALEGRTVEGASGDAGPVSSRAPVEKEPEMRGLEVIAGNVSNAVHDDPTAPLFKCPVARCTFRAKSPVAKCGMHGRTVVAV